MPKADEGFSATSAHPAPVYGTLGPISRFGTFADGTRLPDVARVAYRNSPALQKNCGREQIGLRARETIRTRFSPAAAGLRYRRRLAFLGLLENHRHLS